MSTTIRCRRRKLWAVGLLLVGILSLPGSGEDSPYTLALDGVANNSEWAPVERLFNGVPMALVPPGCFMMGSERNADEQPVHKTSFDEPFWIDVHEVVVTELADAMNALGVGVASTWISHEGYNTFTEQFAQTDGVWAPAVGYADSAFFGATWLTAEKVCACRGARLPTEAEWEYAARGPDGLLYPWGNEMVRENIARYTGQMPYYPIDSGGFAFTVGTKPSGASWVGAMDMSGNLYEWVNSIYRGYPYNAEDGREADGTIDSTSERVLRGCAWYHHAYRVDPVEATERFRAAPQASLKFYGFRCARDFDPQDMP